MLYKKLIATFLCCVLVTGGATALPNQAFASDVQPTDYPSQSSITSTTFANPTLLVLEQNGSAETLTMPTDIILKIGTLEWMHNLSAKWNYDSIDTSLLGRQYIEGYITLSDRYSHLWLDDFFSLRVKQPVWIYADDMPAAATETVYLQDSPFVKDIAQFPEIAWNSTQDELEELLAPCIKESLVLLTEDGLSLTCTARIDYDAIDTKTAGTYLPYCIDVPAGLELQEGSFDEYDLSITVLEGTEVEQPTPPDNTEVIETPSEPAPSTEEQVPFYRLPTVRDASSFTPSEIRPELPVDEDVDNKPKVQTSTNEGMANVEVLGSELNSLAAVSNFVPFAASNIEVLLPSESLLELNLQDDDRFAVRMENVPSQSVTVYMDLNNQPVSFSNVFFVNIPWTNDEPMQWTDTAGNVISSMYDEEAGQLSLAFVQPGTVTCKAEENKTIVQAAVPLSGGITSPFAITFVIAALIAAGAVSGAHALAKKQKKRRLS